MRAEAEWRPSIFTRRQDGRWGVSLSARDVQPSSRVQVAVAAPAYADACARYVRGDVLDLGCGRVPLYGMYRANATAVVCADWPSSAHSTPHLDLYCDLTRPLPLRDATFDTVVLTDVLEHLPNPDAAVSDIRRVLRPGGHLVLGVPFLYGIHEAPHDYHRYTVHRLRDLCEKNALTPVHIRPHGGAWSVWTDLTVKIVARAPGGNIPARIASRAGAWLAARSAVQPDTPMPSGYTLVARAK